MASKPKTKTVWVLRNIATKEEHDLTNKVTRFGRDSTKCDIVFKEKYISHLHCAIGRFKKKYQLRNCVSRAFFYSYTLPRAWIWFYKGT